MFAPYCETHGSRVLLPVSNISAIARDGEGLIAWYSCTCGYAGTWRPSRPV